MRFARALSLLFIFSLASSFTLACAFACQSPAVPAVKSHCHQVEAKAEPAPFNMSAFAPSPVTCPVLAELDSRPASLSASSLVKFSVQPQMVLPLETAMLTGSEPLPSVIARSSPISGFPLYLKKRVLRI